MVCISPRFRGYLLFLLLVAPVCLAHPIPDIPVRGIFDADGHFEIQVEVDPRCFEADAEKTPYLLEEQRLALTDEQRTALLKKAGEFIDRSVSVHFTAAEGLIPAFGYSFTTLDNAPLTKVDDPVMITGRWRGTLPKNVRDYSVTAKEGGQFSVLYLNTVSGLKLERFQVLFPGESSYKIDLRRVLNPPSRVVLWNAAFQSAMVTGFLYVWSHGFEHLLVVFCLCLISSARSDWISQIKVFGVCQLLMVPWIHLPVPSYVGLITAASLIVMALINFVQRPLENWRLVLAAGFGIAHGLALSAHLRTQEAVQDSLSAAAPGYLIGVSGAQLMGLLMLSGLTQPLSHPVAFRKLVTNPLAMLIAGVGVWLLMHRFNG